MRNRGSGSHHSRRFARGGGRHGDTPHTHDHEPGHTHEGRHRHGRGGGRRSSRVFDHGELRYVILALIAEQPRHGYEIIKAIEDRLAGAYSPSPGVVYPTLTMLEELGQATVAESGGKKLYAITPDGEAHLAGNRVVLNGALARMDAVRAAHGGGPAPQIVRATENLKLALRLRQSRGPLTPEQADSIAAALDAAALAVERS